MADQYQVPTGSQLLSNEPTEICAWLADFSEQLGEFVESQNNDPPLVATPEWGDEWADIADLIRNEYPQLLADDPAEQPETSASLQPLLNTAGVENGWSEQTFQGENQLFWQSQSESIMDIPQNELLSSAINEQDVVRLFEADDAMEIPNINVLERYSLESVRISCRCCQDGLVDMHMPRDIDEFADKVRADGVRVFMSPRTKEGITKKLGETGAKLEDIVKQFKTSHCTVRRIRKGTSPDMVQTREQFNGQMTKILTKINSEFSELPAAVLEYIIAAAVDNY